MLIFFHNHIRLLFATKEFPAYCKTVEITINFSQKHLNTSVWTVRSVILHSQLVILQSIMLAQFYYFAISKKISTIQL